MNLHEIPFYLHLAALAVAACGLLYADKIGLSWMRGRTETVPSRTLLVLHEVVSVALIVLILTGLYLFWPLREYLLHQRLFYIKMSFVALLVVNSIAIDNLMHTAAHTPFRDLPARLRTGLFVSGGLSFLCWVGAGLAALLLFGL
ncbi:MAG TPA: hypothetical protein VG934_01255 [Candidatus Paceibacterota bacterium]|nr:hypothetical protein [Candidatus Paceibacterota bacterium]